MANKDEIKVWNPLTDEGKEKMFGVKVERLTLDETLKKYGHILTEDEKLYLKDSLKQ